MGTDVVIDIVGAKEYKMQIDEDLERIKKFFDDMENRFSRFRASSELSFVNAHIGAYVQVSQDFISVLDDAISFHHASRGIFDPRIHDALVRAGYDRDFHTNDLSEKNAMNDEKHVEVSQKLLRDEIIIDRQHRTVWIARAIDLSGIVKGWAVDHARQLIPANVDGYIIDAGGDMWVQGVDENGEKWYIGIEGTTDEDILMKVDGEGMATSGVTRRQWSHGVERRHHLIDPRHARQFSFDLSTVTVISHTAEEADIWAKVLFLKGLNDGLAYANAHHLKAIFIDHNNEIYVSQCAQKNIV